MTDIHTLQDLEDRLSEPTPGLLDTLRQLPGDLLVLGVGGKMGPTLARMARRAFDQLGRRDRVFGVARFSAGALAALLLWVPWGAKAAPKTDEKVTVKVWSLPDKTSNVPQDLAAYRICERFRHLHPNINLVSTTSLQLLGDSMDAGPLMSIAGGISPDIIYVNFRQSDTYISQGFLAPLDEYVARMDPKERAERIPPSVEPVVNRPGPGGKHYWAIPEQQPLAIVLLYRLDLFRAAGLDPEKPPQDWNELLDYSRRIADPSRGIYALSFPTGPAASWGIYSYLCSGGVQAVTQQSDGSWRATFDTPEAVTAYEFVDDLQKEEVTKNGKTGRMACRGADIGENWKDGKIAMMFNYIGGGEVNIGDPQLIGAAPVPKGPAGKSSSEVNCKMMGIFAGQKDPRIRDAAWEYMQFIDSDEARRIFTQTMVEQGAWRQVSPKRLRQYGYPELAKLIPPGLEEASETALRQGTPEPYGRNCQYVYSYLSEPLDKIYLSNFTGMKRDEKRARIQEILTRAVRKTNEKMIGVIPEAVRKKRAIIAWIVTVAVGLSFATLIHRIFSWMNLMRPPVLEGEAAYKTRVAALLIAPALALILMWQYYPLARGSLIAFQNYSVVGNSSWVGINNFADVLFDAQFWLSLKNAAYFCALWMLMGFLPPIFLAVMLHEIPRGKILFRTLFYLPAVVTGVVILFMWRKIYDPSPDGILNRILAVIHIKPHAWLDDPKTAMICLVLPLAWANLGPGCIIYLAALKGIPNELYEASDIDGASFFGKLRYIVFPYLKPLLVINAVGAFAAGFKSGEAVVATTGGGPDFATHVVGYEIWQRTFLYLQFGHGAAMAWILGVLLLSFTAYQLKILNKVEFRTANR